MTTVRRATLGDAPVMAKLLAQLGYPTDEALVPQRVSTVEEDGGVVLVAVDERDRVVGLCSAARHATIHAQEPVAYITALVTLVGARGQGVGRALVSAVERWAREHGCTRLSVTSAEHRDDAHAFYPRCGMPYSGRRFTKRLDGATAHDR